MSLEHLVKKKILFIVNVDWFFLSHRLPIAIEAMKKGYDVHLATAVTDKKDELVTYGFTVHELPSDRGKTNFFSLLKTFFKIRSIIKDMQPDLVHLVTIKPVLLGGLAAKLVGVKGRVVAISGLGAIFIANGMIASFRRFLVKQLYRLALNNPDIKVIFQNSDDKNVIQKIVDLDQTQIEMIPGSGVDLDIFSHSPLPDGPPIVMLAARLLRDKGVIEFITSIRLLKEKSSAVTIPVRFVLVGDPDPYNPASLTHEELIRFEKEGLVELWGYQAAMHKILPRAHIVVLPSYREGFPKVLIEAAACGRAVVTTDVPGCRDAIISGETGLLVPTRDAGALCEAIETLLRDPKRLDEMGKSGRKLAEDKYDVRYVIKRHIEIYGALLN